MVTDVVQVAGVEILELHGRFDAYSVPEVEHWLKQIVTRVPARAIIDLSDVHFLDSMALSVLVQGMRQCREQPGDLYLCGLQQPVRSIIEMTRLDKVFVIFPSQETALERFAHEFQS